MSLNIWTRPLEVTDYEEIIHLIKNELGYASLTEDAILNQLDAIKKNMNYQTFVAVCDGKVVGFIGACRFITFNIEGEYLQIIALAVFKEYQNKAIGTKLLDKIELLARNENIAIIGLTSSLHRESAHAFYEKKGYHKHGYKFQKILN